MIEPARDAGGPERRWNSLDALRGIAAFLVVTFHCAQVSTGFATTTHPMRLSTWLEPWAWLKFTPLRLLVCSGPAAVVIFFALSGFVLSLPFLRVRRQPTYYEFVTKRLCRIYPPFAFAILVSAMLYALAQPVSIPSLSPWFNTVLWDRPLSVDYVLRNLMMTGVPSDMTLDLVMWSLVHELRISLIFPVLFILTRRWPLPSMAVSLLIGVTFTAVLAGREADGLGASLVDTGRFIFLFVAGIIIAVRVGTISDALVRLPGKMVAILWVTAVALLMFPGPSVSDYYDFVWGLGAVVLLALTVGSVQAGRLLAAPPLVWLGKVSYSLYLIHVPLLIAMVHLTFGVLPLWVTVVAAVPVSLACAELMHRWVEEPAIGLGRWLSRPPQQTPVVSTARRSVP